MGGITTYTAEMAGRICERLTYGESLREICRGPEMPAASTVFKWLSEQEDFSEQYAKAKEAGIVALAEDILDIADNGTNDWIERNGDEKDKESYQYNGEAIQRSKLRVDARKWILSKLAPKKYGDRVQTDLTVTKKVEHMTDEELDDYISSLTRQGG